MVPLEKLASNVRELSSSSSTPVQNPVSSSSPQMSHHDESQGPQGEDANASNVSPPKHFPPYVELPYHGEHKRAVSAVAFAPTFTNHFDSFYGDYPKLPTTDSVALLASASADATVMIWNITQGMIDEATSSSMGQMSHVSGVKRRKSNSPGKDDDGSRPISSGAGDEDKGGGLINSGQHRSPSSCENKTSPVVDSKALTPLVTLTGHARGINDIAWSITSEYIATASDDKTLRLYDAQTSNPLVEFKGHSNFVFSVNFNPQSNLLVSGSFDETVKVWDIRSGVCISTLPAHSDPVTGVDFNRDGTCIVSGSHDGLIRIWDTATGECLKTIYAEGNPPVSYVKFSPNGRYVLAGTLDSKLRLWDVSAKYSRGDHEHSTSVSDGIASDAATRSEEGVGYGENSSSGGIGNMLRHVHLHHGMRGPSCAKTYDGGHVNSKFCTFSAFAVANPHRHCIVSGSEESKIFLYGLQSRKVEQVLTGHHKDAILAVAAHDSKDLLASGGMSLDKTVRIWAPSAPSL